MPDRLSRDQNSIECYRVRWPDPDVPPGEPTWIYYEVDITQDVALRMVDVFADGRIECDSIAIEERKGDSCPSLVDGSFKENVRGLTVNLVTAVDFEDLWQQGADTPFWFP